MLNSYFQRKKILKKSPLTSFHKIRKKVLKDVVEKTHWELVQENLEELLEEALYTEKFRLQREPFRFFTKRRCKKDQKLWEKVQLGLIYSDQKVHQEKILDDILNHYAQEVGSHFNLMVYRIATKLIPWGFNWLFNAASVKRFLPWGASQSLLSQLRILGEVEILKKLSQKGTILLVPTHQSNLDSMLIGYIIYLLGLPPFSYAAGLNLFSDPILSFFMRYLGSYTVDRKKNNLIYKQVLKNYSIRTLQEGIHTVFFPGGGRSKSGAIEGKLKLGLLGTGLDAQVEAMKLALPRAKVFIVPWVTSYHFVLEAASLIEDFLEHSGKHKYIGVKDESKQIFKILGFFWKLFSSKSMVTVRIGRPLDVFGNFVDEFGHSIGPNGTVIDPKMWLTTCGELKGDLQRDQEYTRELGLKLSQSYLRENTVLNSHLVAFAYFETLRRKYPEYYLYRFLRLSFSQRALTEKEFMNAAETFYQRVHQLAMQGRLHLSEELKNQTNSQWVREGINHLGLFHKTQVIKFSKGMIWTEDMKLLYYYRNRLSGYGLSLLAKVENIENRTELYDSKGFLA